MRPGFERGALAVEFGRRADAGLPHPLQATLAAGGPRLKRTFEARIPEPLATECSGVSSCTPPAPLSRSLFVQEFAALSAF